MKGANRFSVKRLREIEAKIAGIIARGDRANTGNPEQIFLDTADVILLLNISPHTVKYWKSKGILRHIKIRGRFYYKLADIQRMLKKHTLERHIPDENRKILFGKK